MEQRLHLHLPHDATLRRRPRYLRGRLGPRRVAVRVPEVPVAVRDEQPEDDARDRKNEDGPKSHGGCASSEADDGLDADRIVVGVDAGRPVDAPDRLEERLADLERERTLRRRGDHHRGVERLHALGPAAQALEPGDVADLDALLEVGGEHPRGGQLAHHPRERHVVATLEVGADAIAVISAVFDAPDPAASARSLARLFNPQRALTP